MIFACELNTENLIGVRIKLRQTQPNVSFFACANIQFQKPWKSFNYLCTPCPIHQALLFEFGKIHWILFFSVFSVYFFFSPNRSKSFLFQTLLSDFKCMYDMYVWVFVSVLPFVVFFLLKHEYKLSCHVISLSVRHSNKMDVCIVILKEINKKETQSTHKKNYNAQIHNKWYWTLIWKLETLRW